MPQHRRALGRFSPILCSLSLSLPLLPSPRGYAYPTSAPLVLSKIASIRVVCARTNLLVFCFLSMRTLVSSCARHLHKDVLRAPSHSLRLDGLRGTHAVKSICVYAQLPHAPCSLTHSVPSPAVHALCTVAQADERAAVLDTDLRKGSRYGLACSRAGDEIVGVGGDDGNGNEADGDDDDDPWELEWNSPHMLLLQDSRSCPPSSACGPTTACTPLPVFLQTSSVSLSGPLFVLHSDAHPPVCLSCGRATPGSLGTANRAGGAWNPLLTAPPESVQFTEDGHPEESALSMVNAMEERSAGKEAGSLRVISASSSTPTLVHPSNRLTVPPFHSFILFFNSSLFLFCLRAVR